MKKSIINILIVIIAITFLLSSCGVSGTSDASSTPTPTKTVEPTPEPTPIPTTAPAPTPQLPLEFDIITYESNNDDIRLYISTVTLNPEIYEKDSIGYNLAMEIQNETNELDEMIKQQSFEFPATDENYIRYGLNTIIEVAENSDSFVSLYADYYIYTGGAHGNVTRIAYTYSSDGNQITDFTDLLKDGITIEDVEAEINNQIKSIIEDMGPAFYNESISFDDINYLPPFYIQDGVMIIYFQTYEIAPYAYGLPEFAMPSEIFSH